MGQDREQESGRAGAPVPYLAVRLILYHHLQLCQPLLQLRNLGGKRGLRGQDRPFWGQTLGLPLHTLTLTAWENWSCSGLQYSSKVSMSPVGAGALLGLSPDTAFLHFTSSSFCNRRLGKGKR